MDIQSKERNKLRGRMLAVKDLLARERAETERVRILRNEFDKRRTKKIKKPA